MDIQLASFTIPTSDYRFWNENPEIIRQNIQYQIFDCSQGLLFGDIFNFTFEETFHKDFDNGTTLVEYTVIID